ncbi:MAG: hypothetical protein MUE36_07020 [Acidimicrobiales bacterium]|nr:hypothetical protein [Acidimicrobiales bacterium]
MAALVLFVAGLAGVAIRSTAGDGTATGAASSDAAYAIPPAGSSALEYGGDPAAGGSAVYYDDPQGTRFELFTYDRDLMGQTDEQYRTLVESFTTPATTTETIPPFGTVLFRCVEGVDSSAAAIWAGDARIAVLLETRGTDRPCSARIADLSRQMSELRLANQSDWQAFNLSASTTTP